MTVSADPRPQNGANDGSPGFPRLGGDELFVPASHVLIIDRQVSHPAFRLWCVLHRLWFLHEPPVMERLQTLMGTLGPSSATQEATWQPATRRSIERWLTELEQAGWLIWARRGETTRRYHLRTHARSATDTAVLSELRTLLNSGKATLAEVQALLNLMPPLPGDATSESHGVRSGAHHDAEPTSLAAADATPESHGARSGAHHDAEQTSLAAADATPESHGTRSRSTQQAVSASSAPPDATPESHGTRSRSTQQAVLAASAPPDATPESHGTRSRSTQQAVLASRPPSDAVLVSQRGDHPPTAGSEGVMIGALPLVGQGDDTTPESHEAIRGSYDATRESHDATGESHHAILGSYDATPESHEATVGLPSLPGQGADATPESHEAILGSYDATGESQSVAVQGADATPASHDAILGSYDATLASHDAILGSYDATPASHEATIGSQSLPGQGADATLASHDAILGSYDATPESHDAILGSYDATGESHHATLRSHGGRTEGVLMRQKKAPYNEIRENQIHEDPTPPPAATGPQAGDEGGGLTATERYLIRQGFSVKAAREFRALDDATVQADFARRRALGQGIGAIVTTWRVDPPQAEAPQTGLLTAQAAADAKAQALTLAPPDASDLEIQYLALDLEEGLAPAVALAHVQARRAGAGGAR
ncbi:hypothetical protein [Candidatus Chloroploca sp. Khr17]|uniref:hypothetical protein n=1 Tax=Candidatus Chloroploca sp. Khr17 TaxID=2496869 RepID=UPI0013ECFFED|nr:hypothetical protein [Candidatus Chloroploca sp. Khr17]